MSKFSTKPSISSSPNRSEKFQPPPPLITKFLRANVASRSRRGGRSLSSPLFSSLLTKKKSDIETQEPSSPKVTCIGQVRVTRSSNLAESKPKISSCRWLQRVLCSNCFARKPTTRPSTRFWTRWYAGYGHRKVPQVLEQRHSKPAQEEEENDAAAMAETEEDEEEGEGEGEGETMVFVSSSPPKNALLLMRCRSEPRRAEHRFGFSLPPGQKEVDHEEEDEVEEKVAQLGISSRPLILTRCKSEPASKTGSAKLSSREEETSFSSFGKKRRIGFVDRRRQYVHYYR